MQKGDPPSPTPKPPPAVAAAVPAAAAAACARAHLKHDVGVDRAAQVVTGPRTSQMQSRQEIRHAAAA